jgi:glycosyltransferase involved in cell wall biosynthesis
MIRLERPSKVIITGGHELGGLASFAEGLAEGFRELGIPAEVVPPTSIYSQWSVLRDRSILKILSTTAGFASLVARRAICVSHGVPCADVQSWPNVLGFLASYKLAIASPDTEFVAVSEYTAIHLKHLFNMRITAVIQNPVRTIFVEEGATERSERKYITYVGRLHPAKNLGRLLPAVMDVINETPGLKACVVGDGELLPSLRQAYASDSLVEFTGGQDSRSVRDILRQSCVFISGNQTEPFGITYLEALSQGCAIVMPACGGGLEIARELIGKQVQLMPITLERAAISDALRRAVRAERHCFNMANYTAKAVAAKYLEVDMNRYCSNGGWIPSRNQG